MSYIMITDRIKQSVQLISGRKIGKQRIFPITTKIVLVYILFILLSNFSSHYISLMLYRGEMVKLMRQLLAKDLKQVYSYANTQHEVYSIRQDRVDAYNRIEQMAVLDFKHNTSMFLGVDRQGNIGVMASGTGSASTFTDRFTLRTLNENLNRSETEGFISFILNNKKYFGVYKYNPIWELFFIRA